MAGAAPPGSYRGGVGYALGGRPATPSGTYRGGVGYALGGRSLTASARPPWEPPPVPPGLYNPIRDIEGSEGRRGSEQTISGLERQNTNAENDYAANQRILGENEQNHEAAHHEVLARLAEQFKQLGARQLDQASGTGTLYGGALIASAAKRARNERVARAGDERAYAEQKQSDANARAAALRGEGELVGPGGSLTEQLLNARTNEQAFGEGITTLKNTEASQNGYSAPTGPPRGASRPGGFDKINPLTKERYRERKDSRGRTVHEYQTGRTVTL